MYVCLVYFLFYHRVNQSHRKNNENVDSTEFLERVNSGQEEVLSATSFAKKLILKSSNLPKYEEKSFHRVLKMPNTNILETVLFWKKNLQVASILSF